MKKKQKKVIPKTVELRIRIAPMNPEPIDNEYWQFYCSFPRRGSPDTQIVAKTAKQAKEMLEDLLYNKLEGHDNLKYWQ